MTPPFHIREIDHVVLRAKDPARLEAFYTDVLGCPLELRQEHISLTQLRAGRALIDIVPAGADDGLKPDTANMEHFCLRIDPFDEAAIVAHLAAHGVEHDAEAKDRYGAEGRGPSIYLSDPEGNRVELKGPSRPG